jgi:hypothetical protein
MKIIALLFALVLTGCTGDRFRAPTKCDEVSAVMLNPSATRNQVAADVALSAPLARATPQASSYRRAKRTRYRAALAVPQAFTSQLRRRVVSLRGGPWPTSPNIQLSPMSENRGTGALPSLPNSAIGLVRRATRYILPSRQMTARPSQQPSLQPNSS